MAKVYVDQLKSLQIIAEECGVPEIFTKGRVDFGISEKLKSGEITEEKALEMITDKVFILMHKLFVEDKLVEVYYIMLDKDPPEKEERIEIGSIRKVFGNFFKYTLDNLGVLSLIKSLAKVKI